MRIAVALSAFVAIASLSCAEAQSDVTVYPQSGQVLYDPGTGQQRVVPPLLEPWQYGRKPIKLRPPAKHRRAQSEAAETKAPKAAVASAPPPRREPKRTAAAAPPPAQKSAPISGFADFSDLISPQPSQPSPPPKKAAAVAPPPKAPPPVAPPPKRTPAIAPSAKTAAIEPPRKAEAPRVEKPVQPEKPAEVEKPVRKASIEPERPSRAATGSPRDTITFAPNATDPSNSALAVVRNLADSLNDKLSNPAVRIELRAYAGLRGEKSSDTRRLSLKRALVVRQLLIDDGVPSERIDVFALGGAEDNGPLDRVDVFVKS